jgi:hypothetical protein
VVDVREKVIKQEKNGGRKRKKKKLKTETHGRASFQ